MKDKAKDIAKIALCAIFAAIGAYFVGQHAGAVMAGSEEHSLMDGKFIGLLLGTIIFTWEARDQFNSSIFRNPGSAQVQCH